MTQRKSTGFQKLDKLTGGLAYGALVVIGARPGMGKTALALEIARRMAGKPETTIVIFSYEMSAAQIAGRMGGADLPIHVYDDPNITVGDMRKLCKNTENLGAVIIDYFQLIPDPASPCRGGNETAHPLKEMARELNVPAICTSQLSRDCENRADHRPILRDLPSLLRENADQVLLLYRDRYYNRNTPLGDIAECIVAKNRYGNVGTVKLRWDPQQVAFYDNGEQIPF